MPNVHTLYLMHARIHTCMHVRVYVRMHVQENTQHEQCLALALVSGVPWGS